MNEKARALITHGAIWSGDGLDSTRLKSATLLFDELVFVGPEMDSKWRSILRDEGLSAKAEAVLIDVWHDNARAPAFQLYEEGNWPWETGPERLKIAAKAVLSSEFGSEYAESFDGYKLAGYLMTEILYWSRHFPTHCFVGDPRGEAS